MDFFDHQENARKYTGRLVVWFALAVLGIVATTYVVVALFVALLEGRGAADVSGAVIPWRSLWDVQLLLTVGGGVVLLVSAATAIKLVDLRSGGHVVAEMLGGRRLDATLALRPEERQLLNVVEEMSIASGTPVPPVYLLETEHGINAFAAGHGLDDAVVGITRGALDALTRDELQGVIAHELSHVLNGDMRLNLRLMGVAHGIMVIGLAGGLILRGAARLGVRSRRGGALWLVAWLALGAALWLIGSIGTLFGHLLKAAVSRQREYLADASAAQFTRNPQGIASALGKIAGWDEGSRMRHPHTREMAHMLFSFGLGPATARLMSTHPPLEERIRRLDPSTTGRRVTAPRGAPPLNTFAPAVEPDGTAPAGVASLAQAGQPSSAHLRYAQSLINRLPMPLCEAAHEPFQARALIHALLLDPDPAIRGAQERCLAARVEPGSLAATQMLAPEVMRLERQARLPLVEMTLPSLDSLSPQQAQRLIDEVRVLTEADPHMDTFDWALSRVVRHHLARHTGDARPPRARHHGLDRLAASCSVLLSALAHAGQGGMRQASHAFEAGAQRLGLSTLRMQPAERTGFEALDAALASLSGLTPRLKRQLLAACADCVAADRQVSAREAELFRAIAESLQCPVPPLLPGQPLA